MISLQRILFASCKVCGVSEDEVRSKKRTSMRNIARGLYLVIAASYGYRIVEYSAFIHRTHCSCSITRQHYEGYIKIRDKYISGLYEGIMTILNNSQINE